jgi:hypothetical protein
MTNHGKITTSGPEGYQHNVKATDNCENRIGKGQTKAG